MAPLRGKQESTRKERIPYHFRKEKISNFSHNSLEVIDSLDRFGGSLDTTRGHFAAGNAKGGVIDLCKDDTKLGLMIQESYESGQQRKKDRSAMPCQIVSPSKNN